MQAMPTLQIKITATQSRKLSLNALAKDITQSDLVRELIDKLADLQLVSNAPEPQAQADAPVLAVAAPAAASQPQAMGFDTAKGSTAFQQQLREAAAKALES